MVWNKLFFILSDFVMKGTILIRRCERFPVGIYLFKVNSRIRSKICSKLTIKTPEQCQWRHSGVFIVNFEHILHLFLVFLLLTLNMQLLAGLWGRIEVSVECGNLWVTWIFCQLYTLYDRYIENEPKNK